MYRTTVSLGHGIIRSDYSPVIVDATKVDFFLNEISQFGIKSEDLAKIKSSYEDLLKIYAELRYSGFSTRYYLTQKPPRT